MARQLWALVHAASACEKSLFNVATRGRSAEGSEIATSFIYVSKVCQSCHQYVLELANLCVIGKVLNFVLTVYFSDCMDDNREY